MRLVTAFTVLFSKQVIVIKYRPGGARTFFFGHTKPHAYVVMRQVVNNYPIGDVFPDKFSTLSELASLYEGAIKVLEDKTSKEDFFSVSEGMVHLTSKSFLLHKRNLVSGSKVRICR